MLIEEYIFIGCYFGRMMNQSNNIFSYINSLPFNDEGRYLPLEGGNVRSMFVYNETIPVKASIGTKRNIDLPLVEEEGSVEPLEIPENSGLYEPMHFMIFPRNVIGFEYNFYGPRINSLKTYIPNKVHDLVDQVELLPLIRTDIGEIISKMGEIKLFRLGIHRNMREHLRIIDDNIFDAFEKLKENDYSEVVEIVFRSEKYSRKGIRFPILNRLAEFMSRAKDYVDTAEIRAENIENDDKVEKFDLLEQYIISTKEVVKIDENHRSVRINSMFDAINEFYHELREEINRIIDEG